MTIAAKTTAALVKPVTADARIDRFTVGTGGVTAGAIVCMGTDGIVLADGSTGNCYAPLGIALQTATATYKADVVTYGAVECVTGAAEGSEVFPLDGTAGTPSHTQSTKKYSVGVAMSATKVFVRPIMTA